MSFQYRVVPQRNFTFNTRNVDNVPLFKIKHNIFKSSFFLQLLLNETSWILLFGMNSFHIQKNILQFIRSTLNSFFNCFNPKGIKLVTRLRTGLSHLCEQKFKHSFQDSLNPICRCGTDVESCLYFFLHCPLFKKQKTYPPEHY